VFPASFILTPRVATQEVKERLAHDKGLAERDAHHKKMVDTISKDVAGVVEMHRARSAEWYTQVGSRPRTLHLVVVKPLGS